jgi:AcrR family transcriptional regulator
MQAEKIDRRKQRSRQLLREAMMALIIERGYQAITIQDIADRANVSRTTFYLHYTDKDDLLFQSIVEIFDDLASGVAEIKSAMQHGSELAKEWYDASDFQHVAQYADFYRAMLSDKGSPKLLMQILDYLATIYRDTFLVMLVDEQHPPRVPLDVIAAYIAGGEVALVRWWLETGMKETPQQVAKMMVDLCMFGTSWALNIDVRPPTIS